MSQRLRYTIAELKQIGLKLKQNNLKLPKSWPVDAKQFRLTHMKVK